MASRPKPTKGAPKGKAARPLSEQLAELFDPTPKEQQELNVGEESAAPVLNEAHEEDGEPARVIAPRRLAMRSDIELGKKYAGKRTTREDFLDVSPSEDGSDEREPGSGESAEESSEAEIDDEEDKEESESSESAASSTQQPWEAAVLEADKLQAELEKDAAPSIVAPTVDDPKKSEHAKNQRRIFDAVLELRMKLQKPLTVANRLPAPELRSLFTKHSDEASAKYDSLAQSLRATLGEIQSLQKELLSRNPSLCEPASLSRGTKRGLEEKQLDDPVQLHEHIMPLLDPVIEKWQAKTQIASGGAAGKKFRALNQSVSAQVKQAMTEKDKLIKKTQLIRTKARILGSLPTEKDASAQYSVEVYDDTDFYQQLLKDLVQQKADPQNPIQMTRSYLAQRAQLKHRKEVDRRASKGRKIRYKVHEKLVNFMEPVTKETPAVASELFTRLFQN